MKRRARLELLIVAFALLIAPPVGTAWSSLLEDTNNASRSSAQDGDAPRSDDGSIHVNDAEGDVRIYPQDQTAPDQFDYLDLLGFWVDNETLNDLEIGLQVKTLDRPGDFVVGISGVPVGVAFLIGKAEYNVEIRDKETSSCSGDFQATYRFEGGGYASYYRCIPATVDPAAGIVRFKVPRDALTNESYVTFGAGHTIEGLYAYASSSPFANSVVEGRADADVRDRAPDIGTAPTYESALSNVTSSGQISLFTSEPIRLSNGESTTLVYPLNLTNHGNAPDAVLLSVENPEPAWTIRVPPRIEIAAGASVEIPVILSMGFEHRHGEIAFFQVRADSASDASSWSIIHLGVYWLDVPQPAGHHNTLYLHSRNPGQLPSWGYSIGGSPPVSANACRYAATWISPIEDASEEGATDAPAPSCPREDMAAPDQYATTSRVEWRMPLSPALLIGLDFDTSQLGLFKTSIESPYSTSAANLEATLLYCDTSAGAEGPGGPCPGEWIEIGRGTAPPRAMAANTPATFELEVEMLPEADFLPYSKNSNIALSLELTSASPTHAPNVGGPEESPTLHVKGSALVLPLIEYHDPVDQRFQNVGALSLQPLAPFEKFANPGQTISFPFEIKNHAKDEQRVRASIEGHNKEWARVADDTEFVLELGETSNLTLLVEVPADASEGERSELFVVVENTQDPNVVAISRLRASVVDPSTRVIEPEAAFAPTQGGGTPAISLLAASLAVAFAAVVFPQRRR